MSEARPRIAIVDDDESVCKALQRLLRSAGMAVEAFLSGEAFLEWLAGNRIDCLVLDLHMPEVNGFDVLERMTAKGEKVPVIIITGHDSPEAHDRAMSAGATTYLIKPVNDEALLGAIDSAIVRDGLP